MVDAEVDFGEIFVLSNFFSFFGSKAARVVVNYCIIRLYEIFAPPPFSAKIPPVASVVYTKFVKLISPPFSSKSIINSMITFSKFYKDPGIKPEVP